MIGQALSIGLTYSRDPSSYGKAFCASRALRWAVDLWPNDAVPLDLACAVASPVSAQVLATAAFVSQATVVSRRLGSIGTLVGVFAA